VSGKAKQEEAKQIAAAAVNKSLLSIEYTSKYSASPHSLCLMKEHLENLDISDYKQVGEIGFKKPKVRSIGI
jgi:U4/U6.U5 tri-snRNP-associated protein 1